MSIFSQIGHFFVGIASRIGRFFSDLDEKKIENVIRRGFDLIEHAIPAVKLIASASAAFIPGGEIAPAVVAAAVGLEFTAEQIFTATTRVIHDGGRLQLAANVVKTNVLDAISQGKEVKLGDVTLKTAAEVLQLDQSIFIAAAQDAHDLIKYAKK